MKLIEKREIGTTLGHRANWSFAPIIKGLRYLWGSPDLDRLISVKQIKQLLKVTMLHYPNGILLVMGRMVITDYAAIAWSDVVKVRLVRGKVVGYRKKSIIGRGLIGGLLFGTAGALLAGATGIGATEIRDKDQLIIHVIRDGEQRQYVFRCMENSESRIISFFSSRLDGRFVVENF